MAQYSKHSLNQQSENMTQEQIKEGRMIAMFMGLQLSTNPEKCENPKYMDGSISPMEFHAQWEWLIPVIEKILNAPKWEKYKAIYQQSLIGRQETGSFRDDLYSDIVAFIKWYNQQSENMRTFHEQYGIGRAKYTVSFHNGTSTHRDGSPFFDIAIFRNKRKLERFKKDLAEQGYTQTN